MKVGIFVCLVLSGVLLQKGETTYQKAFRVDKANLVSIGRSDYFVLEPGFKLEYANEEGRLVITVLGETEIVDRVETRVVEERESKAGNLVEVSRNFFAIDKITRDVFYFGEDVDMYRNGKVVSHEGAWRSGEKGAKFGLMMPGKPKLGQAYYQELAPKVAMDRAKVMGLVNIKTPAGTFADALWTQESTPLEPKSVENKYYARDLGLVQDADAKLLKKP